MTYAFLDDHANENDKLVEIGGAAAWYWACGLMYCRRKEASRRAKGLRVDFIPESASLSLYGDPLAAEHVKAILRVKLWERAEGGYVVHDYHKVYGKRATDPEPPADDQQNQQRLLSPSQLAARAAGGRARAATASRGPSGKLGPLAKPTSSGPAAPASSGSRSLGSGSGSAGSGSGSSHDPSSPKDLTGNQQPAAPSSPGEAAPPAADDAGNSDPGEATCCPLDLLQRQGVQHMLRELAERLPCPIASLEHEARDFLAYWSIGGGAGTRRTGWPRQLRTRLVKRFQGGDLKPPGAIAHDRRRGDQNGGIDAPIVSSRALLGSLTPERE